MSKLLIIGAGGVGSVATQKCAAQDGIFSEITLASRTVSKCHEIAERSPGDVRVAEIDADDPDQVASLIKETGAEIVLNVALPYQDLSIMDGCLAAGAHYIDTANYEPPDTAKFEYRWQWEYQDRFKERGLMALLGCGFDPGVTGVYTAHALKHHFDEIHQIDIIDCNAGEHGLPFATNFNPEINIREVTAPARHYEDGRWIETPALSTKETFDFPEGIGPKDIYLMYHEELESLAKHIPDVRKMRFWMTFSKSYLTHLEVLGNVGMTRIDPVTYNGVEIVPLKFLKEVLPSPSDLGARTKGQTCIGCHIQGISNGEAKNYNIYNACRHEACFEEVGSQAIAYTTGVPAATGASLLAQGIWKKPGVWNVEQLDPDPFLELVAELGLPWKESTHAAPLDF